MTQQHDYDFNFKEEFKIYQQIGTNASCQTYNDWRNHILTKYHSCNCTKNTLDNFYYYLNRELNSVKTSKDIWSNCIFPFVAIFLSVTMTFIFSIVGSINTYNNAINSIYDLEYIRLLFVFSLFALCSVTLKRPFLGVRSEFNKI